MPVAWREQMSVGVEQIDNDHKHLIGIINEFEREIAKGFDHKILARVLRKLHKYAHEHFKREEGIQRACKYPFFEAHGREHQKLLESLNDFIRRYFVDKTEEITSVSAEEMSQFLRSWLIDHIIKADLRMKPHIEGFVGGGKAEG